MNRFTLTHADYKSSIEIGIENWPFYALDRGSQGRHKQARPGPMPGLPGWIVPLGRLRPTASRGHYRAKLALWRPALAAICRQADTANTNTIQNTFPDFWATLKARYHAPGGVLPEVDGFTVADLVARAAQAAEWQCNECGEIFGDGPDACPFCGSTDTTEADDDGEGW